MLKAIHSIIHSSGSAAVVMAFVASLAVTIVLVSTTIDLCRKRGWVVKPRPDRWHKTTPAHFGGVPLWMGFIIFCYLLLPTSNHLAWKIVGAGSAMFGLGLVDDLFRLRPAPKFFFQLFVAVAVVHWGVIYPLRGSWWGNAAVSLVWLVGITNAFNLLDNMDGLSAGIGLIAAVYLSVFYLGSGLLDYAVLMALTGGAIAGFLIFNFNPARIFMGDAGSLFIGFMLGAGSLLGGTHVSGVPVLVFIPTAFLAIPIFDTFFVSVTRRLRGQPASQGGTDHSSHRLVQFGLKERTAVLLLYALTAISGGIAMAIRHIRFPHAVTLMAFWSLFLLVFGIHLFHGNVAVIFHKDSVKRSIVQRILAQDTLAFLLDPLVLSLCYYFAYFLRFRSAVPVNDVKLFLGSWPLVVGAKFAALWAFKVYKRSWWRSSLSDAYRLAQAAVLGEVSAVLLMIGFYRFAGYSRLVFLLDCLISWIALLGIRASFSFFRESIQGLRSSETIDRRVFVLGTSEQAEVALRFLRGHRIECAGLIDMNGGGDLGRRVWGAPVLGRLDDIARLASLHGVCELVLPENEPIPCPESEFPQFFQHDHLRLSKLGLHAVVMEKAKAVGNASSA